LTKITLPSAGRSLRIRVRDHLAVGRDGTASFKTQGLL
jgi:hypothetical protein